MRHDLRINRRLYIRVEDFEKIFKSVFFAIIAEITKRFERRAIGLKMKVVTYDPYLTPERASDLGVEKVIAEARRVVGDGPTYVSFDVDWLDPAFAPGTGTPEVGGYTPHEAQRMLRGLRGLNLVGGDVVEVSPPFDMSGNTALVGVTMMWEILCLLAEAVAKQKGRV